MNDLPNGSVSQVQTPPHVSSHPEREILVGTGEATMQNVSSEIEVSPELAQLGVTKTSERHEVPPDMALLGMQAVGPSQPVVEIPTANVPLIDDKIVKGLNAPLKSSFRWLAEWCKHELMRAHVHLKIIAGKPVRQAI